MKRLDATWLLAAITLGGFALRLYALDLQPLWWDEGYSVFFATRDFVTMLERTAIDIHPPLYYALLQVWLNLVGKSAIAARMLSVLIGTATIPLMYACARIITKIATRPSPISNLRSLSAPPDMLATPRLRVSLLAALILALAPLHIYYSQEVRMYGLVTLLGLASVRLFIRLLGMTPGKTQTARVALAYILVTTAALYTQYYAAFILTFEISVVLFLVWRDRRLPPTDRAARRSPLAHWLAAWFAIALLYLPWVLYAGPKLYAYVTAKVAIEKYAPLDPVTFLAQYLAAFSVGHLTAWTSFVWASVAMLALMVVGGVQLGKETRRQESKLLGHWSAGLLVYLYACVPLALAYVVNLLYPFHPIRGERLLLFAAPAFYLLVAFGIHALWQRRAMWGALATLLVAIISACSLADFYNVARYPNDDYRSLLAEMQTLAQPNDTFLAIYPWQIGYLEADYTGAPLNIAEVTSNNWQSIIANCQLTILNCRLWLPALQTQGRILEDALDKFLRERAYLVLDDWHGTTRLELFAFADDPPLPRAPRDIVFEDNTTLGDIAVSREPLVAGQDLVRVRFVGTTRAPTIASFRLLDSNGTVWAQTDREIARGLQRLGMALPLGTPPGEYELRVAAYRADNSARLHAQGAQSVPLATITVSTSAQPNLAALPHRAQVDFENGMRLVGYDAPPYVRPGFATPLTLFWQPTRALDRAYNVVLQIQDARGTVFATTRAAPARDIYPTTRWQIGAVVRDPQTILLRGDAPDGVYRLVVALVDATTDARTSTRVIGTLRAQGRAHYFGAPTPTHTFNAQFGDVAQLIGYDWNDARDMLRVVLYWRARATSETSYTVFVHVIDAQGTLRAQRDQIPGAGAYPTTSWVKNEYLVDVYDIALPRAESPRAYTLRIGMYDAATGARLAVFDARAQPLGDFVVISP